MGGQDGQRVQGRIARAYTLEHFGSRFVAITNTYFPTGMNSREALLKMEKLHAHGFRVHKMQATVRVYRANEIIFQDYTETQQEKEEYDRRLGPGMRGTVYRAYMPIGTEWGRFNYDRAISITYLVADNSNVISQVRGGVTTGLKKNGPNTECGEGSWFPAFKTSRSFMCG